jgi:hypothetical protein
MSVETKEMTISPKYASFRAGAAGAADRDRAMKALPFPSNHQCVMRQRNETIFDR